MILNKGGISSIIPLNRGQIRSLIVPDNNSSSTQGRRVSLLTPYESYGGLSYLPRGFNQKSVTNYLMSIAPKTASEAYARAVSVAYLSGTDKVVETIARRVFGSSLHDIPKVSFVMNEATLNALKSLPAAERLIEQAFVKMRESRGQLAEVLGENYFKRTSSAVVFVTADESTLPFTWAAGYRYTTATSIVASDLATIAKYPDSTNIFSNALLSDIFNMGDVRKINRRTPAYHSGSLLGNVSDLCYLDGDTTSLAVNIIEWLARGGEMGFADFEAENVAVTEDILAGKRDLSLDQLRDELSKYDYGLNRVISNFVTPAGKWGKVITTALKGVTRQEVLEYTREGVYPKEIESTIVAGRANKLLEGLDNTVSTAAENTSGEAQMARMFNTLCQKMANENLVFDPIKVTSIAQSVQKKVNFTKENLTALIYLNDILEDSSIGSRTVAGVYLCIAHSKHVFGEGVMGEILLALTCLRSGESMTSLRFFAGHAMNKNRRSMSFRDWMDWAMGDELEVFDIDSQIAFELMFDVEEGSGRGVKAGVTNSAQAVVSLTALGKF